MWHAWNYYVTVVATGIMACSDSQASPLVNILTYFAYTDQIGLKSMVSTCQKLAVRVT
jgi:hypothetical protein